MSLGTLLACIVKGCPWRGPDPHACPMHTPTMSHAWDKQWMLHGGVPRRHTSHRS